MANARFGWKNLIGSRLLGGIRIGGLLTSKRREVKTRHRKVRRRMFMEQMESRLNLAFSVSLSGNYVTFSGAAGTVNDTVTLTQNGSGYLQHTLSGGGLASNTDLDPSTLGVQALLTSEVYGISIYCGEGNDTVTATNWPGVGIYMTGDGGTDTLRGGAGNDYIVGGAGNDTLVGNGGDDYLYGDVGTDNLSGGVGNDQLDGGAENDTLTGGGDDDWLIVTGGDTFNGNGGTDSASIYEATQVTITDTTANVNGVASTPLIEYYSWIYGTENADTIDASAWTGPGITINGYGGDDVLKGGAGNDTISGGAGNDTLEGHGGNDDLRGGEDSDSLFGGDGNDLLDWYGFDGASADLLVGGAGDDYLNVNSLDEFQGGDDSDTVALNEINFLVLTDTSISYGGAPFNHETEAIYYIYGTENADTIDASDWTHAGISIYGFGGDDILKGGAGADYIDGGTGNDTIEGHGGDDNLLGREDNDTIDGGEGNDTINWNENHPEDSDLIQGGAGDDYIAVTGGDEFSGGADYDRVYPYSISQLVITDTTIALNGGAAFLHETEEWYTIGGTDNADTLDLSAWTGPGAPIYGYGGDDVLKGGAGADYLNGAAGNDTLEGNGGNDDLRGGADSDSLLGGDGNDYLDWYEYDGLSADLFVGGAGDDYLNANSLDEFQGGADTDLLALNEISLVTLTDTTISFGGSPFNHEIESIYYIYGTDNDDFIDASAWTGPGISIYGFEGNNHLKGGAGNDYLSAGAGSDTLEGNGGDDDLRGGQGDDLLLGGDGNDYLNWNDSYDNYADNDQMFGGAGDDYIKATENDEFHGEQDTDRVYLFNVSDVVLTNSSITIGAASFSHDDIENWEIYGTEDADSFDASAWTGLGVVFHGNGGDDHLIGSAGDDTLYGGSGADILEGRDGNDYLDAYIWDTDIDTMYPGKGSNTAYGSYYYGMDVVIIQGEATADEFSAHYYGYYLNGEYNSVAYSPTVVFNTNGGDDVATADDGLPYTLIINGLKPSISAVRLGLTVHGIFRDAGDNQTWTGTIDFGDGPVELTLESDKTFSYTLPYEPTEDIVVTVTDDQGNAGTTIVAVPDLVLDANTIDENLGAYNPIGVFSFVNPPHFSEGPYTYEFISGEGDDDNAEFYLSGNQLYTYATYDFETKSSYSVRVRVTDEDGLTLENVFTIVVNDVNESPSAPALDDTYIDENLPAGSTVGVLSSTDPDAGDVVTYSLVDGYGDNASFAIDGGNLNSAAIFDYETNYYYYVLVRATDSAGLYSDSYHTIYVNNVNDAPSDITLSNESLPENEPAGTYVGSFNAFDVDDGAFTFTLVGGTGSTDNGQFEIVDGNLMTTVSFDHESSNARYIRVRATDSGGAFFEKQFTISITNVNEGPTNISVSPSSIAENQPEGSTVGSLATVDPDVGDTFTYTLVAGAGSTNNSSFTIASGVLKTAASFDYETKNTYSIRVRSTDAGGLTTEKILTITVSDENEGQTTVELSNSTLAENNSNGQAIGVISLNNPPSSSQGPFTYALVEGTGSTDNASFQLSNDTLQAASSFDYESKNSYSIRVRVTDEDGLTFESAFVIAVTNVNEAPTDIALSNSSIAENQSSGSTIGALNSTDEDAGDSFTYTLVAGTGSTDNASFTIDGGLLKTTASFDFEAKSSYSVRVRTTDAGGLFTEEAFTIGVTDVNETPTNIGLSNNSIAENQPSGSTIGSLSTTDPDAGDTFVYTLVSGTGSTDNASFVIDNGVLKTTAVFDFEVKNGYSIRVRSTDAAGLFTEKVFAIGVTNVNETPTDIGLSNSSIAENQTSGSTMGSLTSTDPDSSDSFTYTLVAGAGSTDNSSFVIDGGVLKTNAAFDFETKNSYTVRVRTTDAGGLFIEKAFTIGVTDVNETPTDIGLSNNSIAENQSAGSTIGSLSSTDPDAGDGFTYTLVSGTGSEDNASFTIDGSVLKATASFNFEVQNSYSVRVRTTDAGGLFAEKVFTIGVTNVNETPTDIGLSNNSIAENQPSGSPIGTLSTTDPDASDSFTYTLVGGTGSTDNGSFTIDGGVLKTNAAFDFETKSSYSVRVRTTDAGGLFTEKAFTIGVTNVNEAPTDINLSSSSISEGLPSGSDVGALSTLDPDASDSFTYTLVAGTGSDDNASFTIVGGELKTAAVFDYEVKNSFSVRIRSTDSGGLSTEKIFAITVVDEGESAAPEIGGITGAAAVVYKENALNPVVISSAATVADPDSLNFDGGELTVWFSANGSVDDRLSIKHTGDTTGKIGVDYDAKSIRYSGLPIATYTGGEGTAPLVITFNTSATRLAVQAALKAITFANASDNPSTAAREVSFSLTDGDGGVSNTSTRTVNVTAVNDKPLVTASGNLTGYTENGAPVVIDPSVLITDLDSANFDLGKLTVKSAVGGQSSDRFGILASGLITVTGNTVSYDGTPIGTFAGTSSLTVTLNSAATPGRVQELARHVVFSNISDAPSATQRQISFTVADGDGGTSQAALGTLIDLTQVNDGPVLTLSNATTAKYTENGAPALISSAGSVVDVDLLDYAGGVLTVAITGNAMAEDMLSLKSSPGLANKISVDAVNGTIWFTNSLMAIYEVASFSGGDGVSPLVITFNSNALKTEVQAVFKAITFANSSDNPSTALRTVSFTLTDGDGGTSNSVVRSVAVLAKNDAPGVASFGPDVSYNLSGSPVIITDSALVTDVDSADFNTGKLTVALGAGKSSQDRVEISEGNGITVAGNVVSYNGNAIGTFAGTTSLIVTFNSASATPDAVQALLRQLTFRTTASGARAVTVTATVTDGDLGTSALVSKAINLI